MDAREPGAPGGGEYLFSSDWVAVLFAYLPERVEFGRPVYLHGAFRDLCRELPGLFPDFTFGPAGSPVHSQAFDTGIDNLMLSGLLSHELPNLGVYRIDPALKVYAEGLAGKLAGAGAPKLSEWEEVGRRFVELVEINKQKTASELVVY